jgi:cyclopropane fatty-acyl-phospholipid synthase-like methyltransferase
MPADEHTERVRAVRRYYERNTRLFARFGGAPEAASIHRALWPPHVTTHAQALCESYRLVHEAIAPCLDARSPVLDLGCGIGGALRYLAQHAVAGIGVTLSAAQARLACRAGNVSVSEADFHQLPVANDRFAAAFAIEAFVHSPDPTRFFAEAARVVRRGGRLVLIDDMCAGASPRHPALMRAFVRGWHVPSLLTREATQAHAARAGWRECAGFERDLTPQLRLRSPGRVLTRALSGVLSAAGRFSMVAAASAGSVALQGLLAEGDIVYRRLVFERT